MATYTGKLNTFIASTKPGPLPDTWPPDWVIEVVLDNARYSAATDSRIVLAALETGLLKRNHWKVEFDVSDVTPPTVSRVRIQDDRIAYCTGGTFNDRPDGIRLRPFTPTAFADETPKKWGFFFYDSRNAKCREYKGTMLDVYAILEHAWYAQRTVLLTFDSSDLVIGAEIK